MAGLFGSLLAPSIFIGKQAMNHAVFHWMIFSAVFAPLLIGVPLLMLLALLDDFVLPRRHA